MCFRKKVPLAPEATIEEIFDEFIDPVTGKIKDPESYKQRLSIRKK